jgi:hypothetical protein
MNTASEQERGLTSAGIVQFVARGSDSKVVPFKPCGGIKERLSMRAINPYQYAARPPPNLDFTLLG